MLTNVKQSQKKVGAEVGRMRNYNEVVDYLNTLTYAEYNENVIARMQSLDKIFDNVSKKIDTILVSGTNGKSLTLHFAAKLLKEEGFKVGLSYSNHILTYNEQIVSDAQLIQNKDFADVV
ncbi:MAG: FolC bifunctional protein, partial [candidate division TM6 bacterium GW2011_GWF2_36_6]